MATVLTFSQTCYRFEASYADLYSDVWLFADWAKEIGTPEFGITAKDTGIDLVARTRGTEEYHAIQCKCYAATYRVMKADIDSFLTASGKSPLRRSHAGEWCGLSSLQFNEC
jgi:predicted helicase